MDEGLIYVSAEVSKVRDKRKVKITTNLSVFTDFLVFPALRINRPARAEQIEKQGDFLCGCGRGSRRCGIELELPLGLKGDECFLSLEKLSRKFGQSLSKSGRAWVARGRVHLAAGCPTMGNRLFRHQAGRFFQNI